jgi:hypothetical protein
MDTAEQQQLEIVDLESLERRVMVMIQHPKMPEPSECCYGSMFEVMIGEKVIVPPAPLWPKPFVGIVTGFGSGGYTGPVKYLIGRVE